MNHDNFFEKLVENDPNLFFVEIGAMDGITHDDLHPYIKKYNLKGVLVEPVPDQFNKLVNNYKDQQNLFFENSAISNEPETRVMYRVPSEFVGKDGVHDYADGLSSFYKDNLRMIDQNKIVEEQVNCITFQDLINKYSIDKIDILQIDTEGCDLDILKQIDLTKFTPKYIRIEFWNLNNQQQAELHAILKLCGYDFYEYGVDLIAVNTKSEAINYTNCSFKDIWYQQIWQCYQMPKTPTNKKWLALYRKCVLYQKLYPQFQDQDGEWQHVQFFKSFALSKINQNKNSINEYKLLLKLNNLHPKIKVWAEANLKILLPNFNPSNFNCLN